MSTTATKALSAGFGSRGVHGGIAAQRRADSQLHRRVRSCSPPDSNVLRRGGRQADSALCQPSESRREAPDKAVRARLQ